MKCANSDCKWRGDGGVCRLFGGRAAAECIYRVDVARRGRRACAGTAKKTERKGK